MSYLGSILSSISNSKPEHHIPHLGATALKGKRKAVDLPQRDGEPAKVPKPLPKSTTNGSASSQRLNPNRIKPPTTTSTSTSTSSSLVAASTPPGHSPPEPKVPKKGSFAEIMARAGQASLVKSVGIIKHKPKEKLSSKKEALLAKQMVKMRKAGKQVDLKASKEPPLTRDVKSKAATTNTKTTTKSVVYTGTMKPKVQTTYKGTMKPASLASTRHSRPNTPNRRVRQPSPEETSQDSEDASISEDGYSDMEAGFDDVEEEDERAAREARREDEYEKRMLDELKRQKEARKQKSR